MTFKVDFDAKKLTRFMDKTVKRQVPFAMSKTLNDVAFKSRRNIQQNIEKDFNTTKPFIPRSVVVVKSTKRNLVSEVGLLKRAAGFAIHETGGVRKPINRFIAIRDKAGRGTASLPANLLKKDRVFQTSKGVFKGLKKRVNRLWTYVTQVRFQKRPFFEKGVNLAARDMEDTFFENLDRALKTQR